MFLYNPYGERVLDCETSLLIHEKDANFRVRYRYFGLHVASEHYAYVRVVPFVVEDGVLLVGNGTKARPYGQIEARLEGLDGPHHTWEATGTLDACRLVSIGSALVRGEIIGKSQERATFDLLWAAVRDNEDVRAWALQHFPTWTMSAVAGLEKTA